MRDFCKVSSTFWTGPTGKRLREAGRDAQVVASYLITCGSANMIGLYYLALPTLSHETGIPLRRGSGGAWEALRRVEKAGFAQYDAAEELVFVPEMARFQIDAELSPRDKRAPGVLKILRPFLKHRFGIAFHEKYRQPFHLPALESLGVMPAQVEALRRGLQGASEPLRSQEREKETEQEKEQETETDTEPRPSDASAPAATGEEKRPFDPKDPRSVAEAFLACFNDTFSRRRGMTPGILRDVAARRAEDWWAWQIVALPIVVFATTENDKAFRKKISPLWLMRDGKHPRTTRDGYTAGGKHWLEVEYDRVDTVVLTPRLAQIAQAYGVLEKLKKMGATVQEPES